MRNKFGGTCYQCGKWVEPGEGHFERYQGGWRVHHVSCTLIRRGVPIEKSQRIQKKIPKSFEKEKK